MRALQQLPLPSRFPKNKIWSFTQKSGHTWRTGAQLSDPRAALSKRRFQWPTVPLSIWRVVYLISECTARRLPSAVLQAPLFAEPAYVLSNGLNFTSVMAEHHSSVVIRVLCSHVSGYRCFDSASL